MSRKRKAPKKIPILDPKYKSTVIPKLINCTDNEKQFPLEGSGHSKRNYIFSYDFCNGIQKVMSKGKKNHIFTGKSPH